MKPPTIYADTSVFGGAFDPEFDNASKALFDMVRRGQAQLLISDITRKEIADAPAQVRDLLDEMLPYIRLVPIDEEILNLRDAYLAADIVTKNWADDAGHVAAATVAEADLIVSWNFHHIVHYDKIRWYNSVNGMNGYRAIDVRSPNEVIEYEEGL